MHAKPRTMNTRTRVLRQFWRKIQDAHGRPMGWYGPGCWRWSGGPAIRIKGKKYSPLEVALRLYSEKENWNREVIDDPLCAIKDCINPAHKTFGRELSPEELEQGRSGPDRRTKLDEEAIHDIRYAYDVLGESQTALAELYGVTQQNIHAIVNRKTWTHVTDD